MFHTYDERTLEVLKEEGKVLCTVRFSTQAVKADFVSRVTQLAVEVGQEKFGKMAAMRATTKHL